jgi:hypothetical protein
MAKIKATTNKEMKLAIINLLSDPKVKIISWIVKPQLKKVNELQDDEGWQMCELTGNEVITIYCHKKVNEK